jgi:hypothetical protein
MLPYFRAAHALLDLRRVAAFLYYGLFQGAEVILGLGFLLPLLSITNYATLSATFCCLLILPFLSVSNLPIMDGGLSDAPLCP